MFAATRISDHASSKLLQHELRISVLVFARNEYILLSFRIVCPIQALTTTTAASYYRATKILEEICNWAEIPKAFDRVQRFIACDGDSGITRAERTRHRLGESTLRTECVVHMVCNDREYCCESIHDGTPSKLKR